MEETVHFADRGRQVGAWRTFDRAGNVVKETAFDG
jgi:hypothetical protein